MRIRTLMWLATCLLLTPLSLSQSRIPSLAERVALLPDSAKVGVEVGTIKRWGANRSVDRGSLSYCIQDNLSLNKELADHRAKDVEQDKEVTSLNNQLRLSQADNASKDITIMNQAAIIAPLITWARVGKWGTVAVGLTTLWVVYQELKP